MLAVLAVAGAVAVMSRAVPGPQPAAPLPPAPVGDRPDDPTTVSPVWADAVAERTGIPGRALVAYAAATLRLDAEQPGCRLGWPTLAAIGAVESAHGTYGGTHVEPDGRTAEPITGIPLDGSEGVAAIEDSDDGELDGDDAWDRAVGPMQFIPSTWRQWSADGNGDGRADVHNLDDVALAAGRYLCASGGDLSDGTNWRQAVLSYNRSAEYATTVLDTANDYARASKG
ncbi:murein transglycosylase [Jiangella asiatica]|uniref:Murein transglycosylase n=2 Tax=Jiangella asiatica TaxID=2530372 RepID=A0A4V2Z0P0_9ACTN|nr:murein transglycosylase [Jiangella asiatica]